MFMVFIGFVLDFNNRLMCGWQYIKFSSMPVNVTYNIAYTKLYAIAHNTCYSNAANTNANTILVNITNTSCVFKGNWTTGGNFYLITIGV